MAYIDDAGILSEQITSLELEITTVDAGDAQSSTVEFFVNVVFTDGTRLYEPFNPKIPEVSLPPGSDILPPKGQAQTFSLPVPPLVARSLGEIAEV